MCMIILFFIFTSPKITLGSAVILCGAVAKFLTRHREAWGSIPWWVMGPDFCTISIQCMFVSQCFIIIFFFNTFWRGKKNGLNQPVTWLEAVVTGARSKNSSTTNTENMLGKQMNVFIHVGRRHQRWFKTGQQNSCFLNRIFRRNTFLSSADGSWILTDWSTSGSMASSRSGSGSQNSATIRQGWRRVSPKYLVQRTWLLLVSFKLSLMLETHNLHSLQMVS